MSINPAGMDSVTVTVPLHLLNTLEETPFDWLAPGMIRDKVAAYLKVSKSWVYEHTRAREVGRGECLPHIRIGKYLRFDAQAVQVFLARRAHGR